MLGSELCVPSALLNNAHDFLIDVLHSIRIAGPSDSINDTPAMAVAQHKVVAMLSKCQ